MLLLEQFENLTLHSKNAARLKELVLQLAVQGKLTENWRRQNPDVEPAAELLKRIEREKAQLVKEKKIKKENPMEPIVEGEEPYTLPESWSWCRLAEISSILNGRAYKKEELLDDGTPVLRVGNLFTSNKWYYSDLELEDEKYCTPGDLLYAWSASFGPFIWNGPKAIYHYHIWRMDLLKNINKKYLYYFLLNETGRIKASGHGVSMIHMTKQKMEVLLTPLPPLAEQEAIVERVEELMQKIEELEKQTAERMQLKQHLGAAALQQLTAAEDEELEQNWLFLKQHFQTIFDEASNVKKLRETILQLAVQGKLTATWRTQNPTTEPASELLKCIQAEKAKLVKEKKIKKEKPLEPISADKVPYTLPDGWVWCRLGETMKLLSGNAFESKDFNETGGVKCIKITNAGVGSIVETEDYLPAEFKEKYSQFLVFEDDLIIALTRPYIADGMKVSICPPSYHNALLNQRVAVVRTNPEHLYNKYVYLFLRTSYVLNLYKREFEDRGLQPNLKNSHINLLQFPLPPLAEQEAIVAKVEQLMQLCDELEQQIKQSEQEAEALMQAVVQEALQVQAEVMS